MKTSADTAALRKLVAELSLDEKVRLLTGRDLWSTWPIERIGLRRILFSDGPSGVRGERWDERYPSLGLPSATSLSSSWDLDLAEQFGAVLASEARLKDVDVVLGPTINMQRSPLGGRHFEAFSEDPFLTASLAAAYVRGMQANGVGATPKHYVANDFETDRFTVDVRVGERALRELYLRAFEDPVTDSKAWLVMSAYNSINGVTASENDLLEAPLDTEWGFEGVVVSDWGGVRSLESTRHRQDLVMPGPESPWGTALLEAVRSGSVDESVVDEKVLRILRLAARVGALEGFEPAGRPCAERIDGAAFARRVASEGSVLVRNNGILPLRGPRSIAMVGQNARDPRTQGGGSATVIASHIVSPLEAVERAFAGASVLYSLGAVVQEGLRVLDPDRMANPVTGAQGARAEFRDGAGATIYTEDRLASTLVYFGGGAPIAQLGTFIFSTSYTPAQSETVRLGFAAIGHGRLFVDDELVLERDVARQGDDLGASLLAPPVSSFEVPFEAGVPRAIRLELNPEQLQGGMQDTMGVTTGTEPAERQSAASLIEDAARAAAAAEVAIVVVGTNAEAETEGKDRASLSLPGRQDDLVRAVVAANPNTVVVVNAGSPVLMPWRDEAAAVLLTYFGGQEYGNALADILSGDCEPGGRLPTTWPAREEDVPVLEVTPASGAVRYEEGIHIGYRAWLRKKASPAFPFGYGLGYTTWEMDEAAVTQATDGEVHIQVRARNTGARSGKHVIQVYAECPDSAIERPTRWLVGYSVVRCGAGESAVVTIGIPRRSFAHWDGGWHIEHGRYGLLIGSSVDDISAQLWVQL